MERFVIGSGRCGSTLLNHMLAYHPDVLMLSEVLSTIDRTECFSKASCTGAYFSDFLLRSNLLGDILLRRGQATAEMLFDTAAIKSIPALLINTLPAMTDTPDALFHEVIAVAKTFPDQSLTGHYNQLFDWLAQRFGKSAWIERSGTSIECMPQLTNVRPNALYVHLHRDGRDAALSMHQHTYFQLLASFFLNPPDREEIAQTEYGGKPISQSDPFTRRLTTDLLPPSKLGEYWSYQIRMGYRAFAHLNTAQFLEITFEDLIAQPAPVLRKIAGFFQLPDRPDWAENAAELVKGMPKSRYDSLDPSEQRALDEACRTGMELLGRIESPWIIPTLNLVQEVHRNTD